MWVFFQFQYVYFTYAFCNRDKNQVVGGVLLTQVKTPQWYFGSPGIRVTSESVSSNP